jgi:ADP-ribose pyrophosphatase YjhB (NUDIX family)
MPRQSPPKFRSTAMISSCWIPDALYSQIQLTIPIVCVDLLPLCVQSSRIGFILRDSPHQGRVWALIGGRVRRGETLNSAIARHLHETLGMGVDIATPELGSALTVEYLPTAVHPAPHDPRQHSVALTWACPMKGKAVPCGEAHAFQWFSRDEIPWHAIGFGQGQVVASLLNIAPGDRRPACESAAIDL